MYALCLQGELKQKTLTLQNIARAGQMNMCPSRQWGASIPPIFSMGGFSSGPLVDLLQLDLPKHPNHVWKAHRLGMIRLSAAVELWSCRHALGLQSTGAPPAAGRRFSSGAPRRVSANVQVPHSAGRGSKYMRSNSTAWSHHTTQSMRALFVTGGQLNSWDTRQCQLPKAVITMICYFGTYLLATVVYSCRSWLTKALPVPRGQIWELESWLECYYHRFTCIDKYTTHSFSHPAIDKH